MLPQVTNRHLSFLFGIFMLIGLIGFFTPYHEVFNQLSTYNLLLNFLLISFSFRNHFDIYLKTLLCCFIIGFSAELIGVHTGFLFGSYSYTNNLGWQIKQVPLIIGINWAMLSIGAWHISKHFTKVHIYRLILGSLLLVLFDWLMEPVAVYLQFWKWENDTVPILNYITWFAVAFICIWICSKLQNEESGISKVILLSQILFFLILNLKFTQSWK